METFLQGRSAMQTADIWVQERDMRTVIEFCIERFMQQNMWLFKMINDKMIMWRLKAYGFQIMYIIYSDFCHNHYNILTKLERTEIEKEDEVCGQLDAKGKFVDARRKTCATEEACICWIILVHKVIAHTLLLMFCYVGHSKSTMAYIAFDSQKLILK